MVSGTSIILTATFLLLQLVSAQPHHIEVNITVPEYKVDTEDAYLCVSTVLPPHPHKLIGVIPHARQEVVHHILLYGCTEPHIAPKSAGETAVWRCDMQPVCDGPSTIFYGWGRNAPDLRLPDGVGYSVGEQTGIRYIVAQVHYLAVRPPDDHSGVTLVLKPHAVPYAAGMMTFASWFEIPPGKKSHLVEDSCCFKSHQTLTMFAVRVHTHTLGRQVYIIRETWNHSGLETLYTRDPQLPQSFVPSTRHMLYSGDRLTVTCDFDSTNRTTATMAGGTHNDEMCNMYVMVYGKTPYLNMCDGSVADIRNDAPGALPLVATLVQDPSPFWSPPRPDGLIPAPTAHHGNATATATFWDPEEQAAEEEEEDEEEEEEDYQGIEDYAEEFMGIKKDEPMVVDPLGAYGDATSVTTGPDGDVWVLYRASGVWRGDTFDGQNRITRTQTVPEAVVARLDPDNGTVLARWGAGLFYLPHMISSDALGYIWVVDTGRHQVLKFTSEGRLLMTVGTELTPGAGPDHFCKPTQVSVLRDGSFLVADGYCNNRVVMFDKMGKFVAESEPVNPVVHSVLVDECEGLVYAASREAGKVVALHLEPKNRLKLEATYDLAPHGHGQAWALGFGPYGEQLALMWKEGQDARLVSVRFPQQFWTLPGTAQLSPHDFQLGGAPMQLSGAGDRFYAIYLSSVGVACDQGCGPIRKFVMVPSGMHLPDPAVLPISSHASDIHPGDAKLLPGGTAVSEQPHHHEEAEKEKIEAGGKAAAEGVVEAAASGEGTTEGGVMVADDYDEELEGDVVDVEDYEAEVAAVEEFERAEEDYLGLLSPPPPKKLEKERFEVLMQDKKVVEHNTSITGWAIALLVVLAALMGFSVLHFSKVTLSAYLGTDKEGSGRGGAAGTTALSLPTSVPRTSGGGSAPRGGAPGAAPSGKRSGVWTMAEGLLARMPGPGGKAGGGGGASPVLAGGARGGATGSAAREVEAARERERLLRSEP